LPRKALRIDLAALTWFFQDLLKPLSEARLILIAPLTDHPKRTLDSKLLKSDRKPLITSLLVTGRANVLFWILNLGQPGSQALRAWQPAPTHRLWPTFRRPPNIDFRP
jgi:hypothetical protein